MSSIEKGQVYVACDGSGRRIRVAHRPITIPGTWGFGKVEVETIDAEGRWLRLRRVEITQLHDSPLTKTGRPRRTGYVLDGAR